MLTAGIGLVHALLLMAGAFVLKTQTPGVAASDEELIAFYQDPEQRRIAVAAGLYLIPFAGIAFIWFFVALRMWISASAPRANVMLSNVQLVSGIIYTTLILAAGGAMSVPAVTVELSKEAVDPLLARQLPQYGASLLLVFAMRMAAMFVLTTTNLGRLSGILPKWFIGIGFVMAAGLLLTASFSSWLVFVFPALGSRVLRRAHRSRQKDLARSRGFGTGRAGAAATGRAIVTRPRRRGDLLSRCADSHLLSVSSPGPQP